MKKFLRWKFCVILFTFIAVLLSDLLPVQGFFAQEEIDWRYKFFLPLVLVANSGLIDEGTPIPSLAPSATPTPVLVATQTPISATPTTTPFPTPTPVTVPPFSKGVDCEIKNYKMGFVLLVKNQEDVAAQLPSIDSMKNAFPDAFSQATKGLSSIDASNDVLVMNFKDNMLNPILGQYEINPIIVAQEFYKIRGDTYDFLTIFTTFPTDVSGAYHIGLVNNIAGIGLGLYDISFAAGSSGKLKGIVFMGEIKRIVSGIGALNLLLHETGHQWGIYAGDPFTGKGGRLEIKDIRAHWYRGLRSSYLAGDPLGADYWVMNQDGSYRRDNQINMLQQYHDFMLYFMGLLPPSKFSEKNQILNAGVVGIDFNPERAVPYKEVSANDIIAAEGIRKCYLPQ